MAITVSNVYIETFENNVRFLAQQGMAKLRAHVVEKATNGEKHNWDRLAAGTAVEKTTARQATPEQDLVWSRRVSIASTWNAGATTEQEDIVQMLIDPNSSQAQALAMAMARAVDDLIIVAAIFYEICHFKRGSLWRAQKCGGARAGSLCGGSLYPE